MNNDPDDSRLTAYLLGEMSEKEAAALEAELAASEPLRNEMDEIRRTLNLVDKELKSEPEYALLDEQRRRIQQQIELQARNGYGRTKWFAAGGLSVAACLLLAFSLHSVWRMNRAPSQAMPEVASLEAPGERPRQPGSIPPVAGGSESKAFETRTDRASDLIKFRSKNSAEPEKSSTGALLSQPAAPSRRSAADGFADNTVTPAAKARSNAEREEKLAAAAPEPAIGSSFVAIANQEEKDKASKKEQSANISLKRDLDRQDRNVADTAVAPPTYSPVQGRTIAAAATGGVVAEGRLLKAQLSPALSGLRVSLSQSVLRLRLGPGLEKLRWVIGVQAADISEAELHVKQVRNSGQTLEELFDWPLTAINIAPALIEINAPASFSDGLLVYVRAPVKTRVVIESRGKPVVDTELKDSLLLRDGVLLKEKVEGMRSLLSAGIGGK